MRLLAPWRLPLSDYTDLLIQQYIRKPKARATINLWCGELDKVKENIVDLLSQIDIDNATGYSLDIIGRRVGVSRTLPSFASKGYFAWKGAVGGKGWNKGVWYRYGESTTDTIVLEDFDFRFLIKAKILRNFQDGSLDYILNALVKLFGSNVNLIDNYDMTCTILLPLATLRQAQVYMLSELDILPRPVGVKYTVQDIGVKAFGFDGFINSEGFGEGSFIDA